MNRRMAKKIYRRWMQAQPGEKLGYSRQTVWRAALKYGPPAIKDIFTNPSMGSKALIWVLFGAKR